MGLNGEAAEGVKGARERKARGRAAPYDANDERILSSTAWTVHYGTMAVSQRTWLARNAS